MVVSVFSESPLTTRVAVYAALGFIRKCLADGLVQSQRSPHGEVLVRKSSTPSLRVVWAGPPPASSLTFPDDTRPVSHRTRALNPALPGSSPVLAVLKLTEILKYIERVMRASFVLSVIIADIYSKSINIEGGVVL